MYQGPCLPSVCTPKTLLKIHVSWGRTRKGMLAPETKKQVGVILILRSCYVSEPSYVSKAQRFSIMLINIQSKSKLLWIYTR